MAIIRPFPAIRPDRHYAQQVISLPYDVISRTEAKKLAETNPYSFLHICRSEIDLPDDCDPYAPMVYEKAKRNIEGYLTDEIFIQESKPMLYIYRQTMNGRAQTGIVACVSVDEYQDNTIKKHELTRVEKELDRIQHFDVCNVHTEPVFLTYRKENTISQLTQDWMDAHEAAYDFTTADGIGHALWLVDEDSIISALTHLFDHIPSLYIADGHHRSASAVKVGLKRRAQHPQYNGNEAFNFYMAVLFPDADLKIDAYNRIVKDLHGLSPQSFLTQLSRSFQVEPVSNGSYAPPHKHIISMYLHHRWYNLIPKDCILSKDIVENLDVSLLQTHVLHPLLGIEDPRTDKRIDFVGGIRGLDELEQRCQSGEQVAFALYPVSMADLLTISDEGKIMPPKSTWFEPKLGSGLFMHQL